MPSALQRKTRRHNPLCAASRLGIQAMASLSKASRAEFSHQFFPGAAETCLQIFRFVIGALRSVSGQTSSRDYRTRRTGSPENTGGGRCCFVVYASYKFRLTRKDSGQSRAYPTKWSSSSNSSQMSCVSVNSSSNNGATLDIGQNPSLNTSSY